VASLLETQTKTPERMNRMPTNAVGVICCSPSSLLIKVVNKKVKLFVIGATKEMSLFDRL